MSTPTEFHNRAMLVYLSISSWAARKYDRKVTAAVNEQYNSKAARVNKPLFAHDAPSYQKVAGLAGSIRVQHYAKTTAWSDDGWRLLPMVEFMDYCDWYRDIQTQYIEAADAFEVDYPALAQAARVGLDGVGANGLWRAEDYPSQEKVRRKFAIKVLYDKLPIVGSDVRTGLGDVAIKAIEDSTRANMEYSMRNAAADVLKRLIDTVAHVNNTLNEPEKIFRDSLIENVTEACAALEKFNVFEDPILEDARKRVLADLTVHDPELLRESPTLREEVAAKADAILASMRGVYGIGA